MKEGIQTGIKMAIASLLALLFALWLKLQVPAWAVLSCLLLMTSKYVGDLVEKSLLRLLGTVVGGILGVWLVSDYQQNPVFFLTATALLMGYCAYRFGGNSYPYGWYLCGFTIAVIVSDALFTPNAAWQTALARVEEIFVGLLASLVVSTVLWPRYARVDFQAAAQEQIRDIARLLTKLSVLNYSPQPEDAALIETIKHRLTKLRSLLQSGSRESRYFRMHLETFSGIVACLASLQQAGRELARERISALNLRDHFSKELAVLYDALQEEFKKLTTCDIKNMPPITPGLEEALNSLDQAIREFRERKSVLQYDIRAFADFASYYLSIKQIITFTNELRNIIANPNFSGDSLFHISRAIPSLTPTSKIDPIWIRIGIKSAITFSLALLFINWMRPPNGFIIPIFAFLFTVQSRDFAGGKGDQEIFQTVAKASLIGIPFFLGYYALCPALSHYAIMNFFLFCYVVTFGFIVSPHMPTLSYGQVVATYIVVPLIAINPQHPVAVQSVITFYLATFTGLFFSAIIQRTIFPILPQYEIRNRICKFFELFALIQKQGRAASLNEFYQIIILPNEIRSWATGLRGRVFNNEEIAKLEAFVAILDQLAHQIKCSQYKVPADIPSEVVTLANPIDLQFNEMADAIAKAVPLAFKTGNPPDTAPAEHIITICNNFLKELRDHYLPFSADNLSVIQFLAHYDNLSYTAQLTSNCLTQLGQLKLQEYSRDRVL